MATPQIPDLLIYKKDTLKIFANPLEYHPQRQSIKTDFQAENTACWCGYIAVWTIENDTLYLLNMYDCDFDKKHPADLSKIFGSSFKNGKVKADWYSGEMISPQGNLIHYIHMGYGSLYEREQGFIMEKGILKEVINYDNSPSKRSIYSENQKLLKDFIYQHINWKILPINKNDNFRIFVAFSANEKGKVDSIHFIITRPDSVKNKEIFEKEVIRVIKSLPEWDVYFRHGKNLRYRWNMPVIFNEENRKKYKNY